MDSCSFCGEHKDDVPYLMCSPVTNAGICTHCVFGMSIENVRWASGVFNAVKADHERKQQAPPRIIMPDASTEEAIDKVQKVNGKKAE